VLPNTSAQSTELFLWEHQISGRFPCNPYKHLTDDQACTLTNSTETLHRLCTTRAYTFKGSFLECRSIHSHWGKKFT